MRVSTPILLAGSAAALLISALLAFAEPISSAPAPASTDAYDRSETAAWRAKKEAQLNTPDGWLSVAGLFFLGPGPNRVGADPSSTVVLPADAAPARVGTIIVDGPRVFFEPAPGADVKLQNAPVTARVELSRGAADAAAPPIRLTIGRLTLHLHHSGERLAVRLRDPESALRRQFTGLRWYDIGPAWQLTGKWVPFAQPKTVRIHNVLGDAEDLTSPGEVAVTIGGRAVRLLAVAEKPGDKLWFIFSDTTAQKETYRIRFLYADPPAADGRVTLDFNRAYNPPCAYNPYTTCPLPPPQNKLAVRIPAGERRYHATLANGTR